MSQDREPPAGALASFGGEEPPGAPRPAQDAGADAVVAEHVGRYVYGPEGRTDRAAAEAAELGRGGIGRVLVALDTHLGRQVALKELLGGAGGLSADAAGSPRQATAAPLVRFLREARVTGQLEHPGIVPVYELGRRPDGRLYYTMRLVRGQSLAERLRACGGLADRLRLLTHFKDLCQAVAYAHSRGVVHRDLKPHNVMLGEFGETVVLDWGLAKARGHEDVRAQELAPGRSATGDRQLPGCLERPLSLGEDPCHTQDGATLGTPAYMSPEQADGRVDAIDERSDVWGLGAVLHELLTGRPPHEGSTAGEVLGKVLREPVRSVRERCPQAPAELAAICQKALSREPAGRYPDARALAGEIEAFLTGGRVSAYRYGLWDLLRRLAVRHRSAAATAGVALLLLLVLGVLSYLGVVAERDRALAAERAERVRAVELLVAGARDALGRGEGLRAGGMLRSALEAEDSLAARALWRRLGQERRLAALPLTGQGFTLAFTPDGEELLLAARSGAVTRVDPRTLTTRTLRSSSPWEPAVALSPDGRRLALAAGGTEVRVLALPGGEQLASLQTGRVSAWGLAFSPDGRRLAVGFAHALRLFDPQRGEVSRELEVPGGLLVSARFQPGGGGLLAAGLSDGRILLWRAEDGRPAGALEGHTDEVREIAFSPDGRRLASASVDHSLRVWDLAPGGGARVLGQHADRAYSVDWSPDGRLLASAGADAVVRVWDVDAGRELLALGGHTRRVMAVRWSPDGQRLASCGLDHELRLWDASAPRPEPAAENPPERVEAVDFGPGGLLALARADGLLELRAVADGALVRTLRADRGDVFAVAFSPDGRRLATGGWDGVVRLWGADDGRLAAELRGHRLWVQSLAFSPDGRWLASGGGDGDIRLWPADGDGPSRLLRGHTRVVGDLRFDGGGRRLASGGTDGSLRVWDVAAGRELLALPADADSFVAGAFPPGGEEVIYPGPGRELRRVRLSDGRAWSLGRPGERLAGLALSPEGDRLTVRADGALWILEAASGRVLERREDLALSRDWRWGWGTCQHGAPCAWDFARGAPAWHGPAGLPVVAEPRTPELALADRLAQGHPDGSLEVHPRVAGPGARPLALQGASASPVLRLLAGPPGSLVAGFADGTLAMWSLENGGLLDAARLHGPIVEVRLEGGRLSAATGLGDQRSWDVSALLAGRCELLRQVWRRVPVVWQAGRLVRLGPPAGHPCSPAR
ncbi:MAG TPA: protein kinase [Myxococcota bacterium]|nr:protein kinase [Myxococcota bacterium]HRY92019.1 protein kinase [Myxococcota bacterium]